MAYGGHLAMPIKGRFSAKRMQGIGRSKKIETVSISARHGLQHIALRTACT